VAFEPGTDNGLAVARFIKDRSDPCTADVAVTVADDWQHRGLGSALLQQLAERATDEGVRWFTATVLETNHEVVALLRKVGPVEHVRTGDGAAELRVELPEGEPCPPVLKEALRAAARGELEVAPGRPGDEEAHED